MLAKQEDNTVSWRHENPLTGSRSKSTPAGQYSAEAEFDPIGVNVGFRDPYVDPNGWVEGPQELGMVNLIPNDPSGRCKIDGFAMRCATVVGFKRMGSAVDAPVEEVTTLRFKNAQGDIRYALGVWTQTSYGTGYLPAGAQFDGPQWWVSLGGGAVGTGWGVYGSQTSQYDSFGHASTKTASLQTPNSAINSNTGPSSSNTGATNTGTQQSNPCAGRRYSDLDWYTPFPRGMKRESGIEHVTKNHILLDNSRTQFYNVPDYGSLVITPQTKSKYLFTQVNSLAQAQALVILGNREVFEGAQRAGTYSINPHTGNFVMYYAFLPRFNPYTKQLAIGLGVLRNSTNITTVGTLIMDGKCQRVISAYPGR